MAGTVMRYRIMALVSGVMSLLLWFVYVPIKAFASNPDLHSNLVWIPMVHGYLYPIYVLAAIQFSIKARWSLPKMVGLILAGTLPVASLITERRVVRQYR
jgi:integral membrane protein